MNAPPPENREVALRGGGRALAAAVGFGLALPLALACWLTPDPHGLGTHQQLGLPPCSFVALFDLRCPSCGMTTAWAHLVRGRAWAALEANVGGALLAAASLLATPWLLASAAAGRWIVWAPRAVVGVTLATTALTVTLVDWALRLWLGR